MERRGGSGSPLAAGGAGQLQSSSATPSSATIGVRAGNGRCLQDSVGEKDNGDVTMVRAVRKDGRTGTPPKELWRISC